MALLCGRLRLLRRSDRHPGQVRHPENGFHGGYRHPHHRGVGVRVADFTYTCIYTLRHHRITVVLAGDIGAVFRVIRHRLVYAAMTVFELFGLCAVRQSRQLMPQTNAEHRQAQVRDFFKVLNDFHVFGGVSRAVGKHDAVKAAVCNFLGSRAGGYYRHLAAALH